MEKKKYKNFEYLSCSQPLIEDRKNLVLIHGASINSYFFINQFEFLCKKLNVYAPDLPGRGGVEAFKNPSVRDYSDYIFDFIKELEIEKPVVCGVSMGGAIVLDMLAEKTTELAGGIVINSGARLKVHDVVYMSIKNDFNSFKKGLLYFGISQKSDPNKFIDKLDLFCVEEPLTAIKDFDACTGFDMMDELSRIKQKVLILTAAEDKSTPVKYGLYLKDNIKNSKYMELSDCGHLSPLEKPDDVNSQILKFMGTV